MGRTDDAERALSDMRAQTPEAIGNRIRQDLIERNGFAPDIVEHLMEGLRKAGFEESPPLKR